MRIKSYTHANLKAPIHVDLDLLAFWYYSEASKSTHLVAAGGAMIPVSESPETITNDKKGEKKTYEPTRKQKRPA